MTKKCFKCQLAKPLVEFYKHPKMGDGHLGKCKDCTRKDSSNRYRRPESRELIRAYDKYRNQTPERKAKTLGYLQKRRLLHPEKDRARRLVGSAVRRGLMEKQPCEICKSPEVQAHHPDYSKPLNVRWLCFIHHRQEHGQLTHSKYV